MQQTIITGVIFISLIFFVLSAAFFLVLDKYYKSKTENTRKVYEAVINAQEQERQRIAQDIHDELGSLLTSLGLYASNLKSSNSNLEEKDRICKIISLIDKAKKETKNASNALAPDSLKKYGIQGAINEIESRFIHTKSLKIEINYQSTLSFSQFVQLQLYRIIMELVTNAVKYSKATIIYIEFIEQKGKLTIQVKDNGIGFDIDKILTSDKVNGHNHIINRVKSLNGYYLYNSTPSVGSTFNFEFDLKNLMK